jgi:hypothetical protein
MLKLVDLRKTTRRAKSSDLRVVFPHLLRDRSLAPRIEIAIRYLETMLGRPRRELDEEVIVQLFGDHKIARCIVACLAATYRHRARTFAEVLPVEQVATLAKQGITGPSELRLRIFRRANLALSGFVGGAERVPFLQEASAELGLLADQVETLLTLDAPANAVLVRVGRTPTPDDVIARFNYETVAALLANAALVRLTLQRALKDEADVRALLEQVGVRGEICGREVVLHGQQDAMGGWARHGARLVRLLAGLLACGLPVRSGEATVAAPMGDEWLFRLDTTTLADLGASTSSAPFSPAGLLASWQQVNDLLVDFTALRRAGDHEDWAVRRATEPLVLAGAVLPALAYCIRGGQRVPLVPLPETPVGAERVATIAARMPLVALQVGTTASAGTASLPTLSYRRRGDSAALPQLLARVVGAVEARAERDHIAAVFAEVRRIGVLSELRLAERLGCDEEEVALRLALPAARALRQTDDIHYIEGFGLCTAEMLAQARAQAAEVERLRDKQAVGTAWVLRHLGRRLRTVTGTSEGIECLIAYLGAA